MSIVEPSCDKGLGINKKTRSVLEVGSCRNNVKVATAPYMELYSKPWVSKSEYTHPTVK